MRAHGAGSDARTVRQSHDSAWHAHIRNRKAYLFRMAANLATDHQRSVQNRSALLVEAHDLLWGDVDHRHPERTLIARQELARLEQALAQLPPMSRRIFHLNRYERKTQLDIADELGVSISTVESPHPQSPHPSRRRSRSLNAIGEFQVEVLVLEAAPGKGFWVALMCHSRESGNPVIENPNWRDLWEEIL